MAHYCGEHLHKDIFDNDFYSMTFIVVCDEMNLFQIETFQFFIEVFDDLVQSKVSLSM